MALITFPCWGQKLIHVSKEIPGDVKQDSAPHPYPHPHSLPMRLE